MGGSAFLVYGRVDEQLLQPRPASRSLLDRMLGRVRTEVPTWSQIGRERRMIDLPSNALKAIGAEFRDYVATRLNPPWAATAAVLEYLGLNVFGLHLRGDASGNNPPEWYVQLGFSGSAGMSEVSSELATHWVERWYHEEQADLVRRHLKPYGFEPNGRTEPDRSSAIFVPFGVAGYALYNPTPRDADEHHLESRYFDIDNAALETLGDEERSTILRKLDQDLPPMLPVDSCCCQLCAPEFDVTTCERMVPFR